MKNNSKYSEITRSKLIELVMNERVPLTKAAKMLNVPYVNAYMWIRHRLKKKPTKQSSITISDDMNNADFKQFAHNLYKVIVSVQTMISQFKQKS